MDAFTFYNPTKIVFGKDCVSKLSEELARYGQTVLLTVAVVSRRMAFMRP